MKYFLLFICLSTTFFFSLSQEEKNISASHQDIEQYLTNWDPIRGAWLAESLLAIEEGKTIPDRTFPENMTPHQMMNHVPFSVRENILSSLENKRSNVYRFVLSTMCLSDKDSRSRRNRNRAARSYGDPHIVTYDGQRYSFQTVGEFVLTKSKQQNFEVQVRQKPMGDNFSVNTAIAMNLGGDRVGYYAEDIPDGDFSHPIRLNGLPVQLKGNKFFLPHGGVILKSGANSYEFYSPTGEIVSIKERSSNMISFIDIAIKKIDCIEYDFTGMLGNANRNPGDDFSTIRVSSNDYFNRKRQELITKQFAETVRVTNETSLFDYPLNLTTEAFTDRSYPRVYMDLSNVNNRQRSRAERRCRSMGVSDEDLNACIFDNAYLGFEPSPRPVLKDPTVGTVLKPVRKPIENTTPLPKPKPIKETIEIKNPDTEQQNGNAQPIQEKPNKNEAETQTSKEEEPLIHQKEPSSPKPTIVRKPKPVAKPRPAPRPIPVVKPKPTPKPSPTPKPKPTPKPVSKPGVKTRG